MKHFCAKINDEMILLKKILKLIHVCESSHGNERSSIIIYLVIVHQIKMILMLVHNKWNGIYLGDTENDNLYVVT